MCRSHYWIINEIKICSIISNEVIRIIKITKFLETTSKRTEGKNSRRNCSLKTIEGEGGGRGVGRRGVILEDHYADRLKPHGSNGDNYGDCYIRIQVSMVVNIVILRVVIPYSLVGGYQRF
jgi:hypothetical protein